MDHTGQVTSSAAEFHEAFFVPALFEEWTWRVVAAAGLRPPMEVLDVACGTGVLTKMAATSVLPGGRVVGVDLNPGMLAVARRKDAPIEWCEAPAESLPYGAGTFDAEAASSRRTAALHLSDSIGLATIRACNSSSLQRRSC